MTRSSLPGATVHRARLLIAFLAADIGFRASKSACDHVRLSLKLSDTVCIERIRRSIWDGVGPLSETGLNEARGLAVGLECLCSDADGWILSHRDALKKGRET